MHADGYFALVLSEASSELLRRSFATLARPIAHHCTVRYGTSNPADLPPPFSPADLGRTFALEVRGFRTRADVQAVVVALVLPDGRVVERGFSANEVPHVTVATDGVTEPVAANELLAGGFEPIDDGPRIVATLAHVAAPVVQDEPCSAGVADR